MMPPTQIPAMMITLTLLILSWTEVDATNNIFNRGGRSDSSSSSSGSILRQQGGGAGEGQEVINKRAIECPGSQTPVFGYDNIQDIVDDQKEEFDRIQSGQEPRPPYIFPLCGNTQFNMTVPAGEAENTAAALTVVLDDITFTCESNGGCIFSGGDLLQVLIDDNSDLGTGYTTTKAKFQGITFTGFVVASVNAAAKINNSKTSFVNCTWKDFNANHIIANHGSNETVMNIEIIDSTVQDGQADTFFSSAGGTLLLDNVRFENIQAIRAVASYAGASFFLNQVLVKNGALDSFAVAQSGAANTVVGTTISGLTRIDDVFLVQGEGTSMIMTNTTIRDNLIEGASPFTAVRVLDGAKAEVKRSAFVGNTGVSFGFLSRNNSNLELVDVDITGNTGIAGALTATTYADKDAQLTLQHVTWEDNFSFTAQVFALFAAKVDISASCFNSGGGDTILFISEDSSYTDVNNFMNSYNMTSTSCMDPRNGRLARERFNSGCYDPNDSQSCKFGCERFGTSNQCVATSAPTTVPTTAPSINVPTTSLVCAPLASPTVTLIPLNLEVNKRAVKCSNSSLVGYDKIQDIINDQQEEFQKIQAGQKPRPPYIFPLCPNTQFDTRTAALIVLLDGVTFFCGNTGASTEGCIFSGGSQQVRLEDSTLEGYTTTARFHGITFTGFSDASIFAFSQNGSKASFVDCIWKDYYAKFVINMGAGDGAAVNAVEVEVTGSSEVRNGGGTTCFSNQGGTLIVNDLQFENVRAKNAIETFSGGATTLNNVNFDGGELKKFAFAYGAATQTIICTTVSGLTAVEHIFSVLGVGTSMMMENTHMRNNLVRKPSPFSGVGVLDGATATVKHSSFAGNTEVKNGFLSRNGATLELVDVDILSNTGIDADLTACTRVEENAQLMLHHVAFEDNFNFTGQVLALSAGNAKVSTSCFDSGGGDTILFISENSTYTDVNNFMSTDMTSLTCKDDSVGGRLAQEHPNSGCFDISEDPNPCSLFCKPFGTSDECLIPTPAPTSFPSMAPSASDEVCTIEEDVSKTNNPVKTFPSLELPCPAMGQTVLASLEFFLLGGGQGDTTTDTTAVVVSVAASHGGGSSSSEANIGISMMNDWMLHRDTTSVEVERSYNASSCFDLSNFYSRVGFNGDESAAAAAAAAAAGTAKTANANCTGTLNAPNKLCDTSVIDYNHQNLPGEPQQQGQGQSNPAAAATTAGSAGSVVKNTVAIRNNGGCKGNLLLEANIIMKVSGSSSSTTPTTTTTTTTTSSSSSNVVSMVSCMTGLIQETPCKDEDDDQQQEEILICPEQHKALVDCFAEGEGASCKQNDCDPKDLRDRVFSMATGGDYALGNSNNNQDYCEAVSSNLCTSLEKERTTTTPTSCNDQIEDYILCLAQDQCRGDGTTSPPPLSCDGSPESGAAPNSSFRRGGLRTIMMMMMMIGATTLLAFVLQY